MYIHIYIYIYIYTYICTFIDLCFAPRFGYFPVFESRSPKYAFRLLLNSMQPGSPVRIPEILLVVFGSPSRAHKHVILVKFLATIVNYGNGL